MTTTKCKCALCGKTWEPDEDEEIETTDSGEPWCGDCNENDYESSWEDDMDAADRGGNSERAHAIFLNHYGVQRKCCYCGCGFIGMPDHGVCNSCADKLEQGMDLEYADDGEDDQSEGE
jgi:hypothetical protein